MSLIDYMKREMKIRRPFLYLLTAALSLMVGWGSMYMLEGRKVAKLREQISELNIKIVETRQEYEKRLKDKSKTISIKKPDGTITTETFNDISSEESGTVLISSSQLASKLRLTEVEYQSNWTIQLHYSPSLSFSDVSTGLVGVGVSRKVLGGFTVGGIVQYDMPENRWWLGLSLGYEF